MAYQSRQSVEGRDVDRLGEGVNDPAATYLMGWILARRLSKLES